MRRISVLIVLFTIFNICFGQKNEILQENYPLIINHYDLKLLFDFSNEILDGTCNVTIENKSDSSIDKIPFLLYRLMTVNSIQNQQGKELNFSQKNVSFPDFEKLQVNSIKIDENILPHSTIALKIQYSGHLLGYQETGMQYVKDKISENFTLIRNDAYSYPILAKPSIDFLRKNILSNNFTYRLSVTVPDTLMVANGGLLLSKTTENGNVTYKYESKEPSWRIDIAVVLAP